MLNSVLGPISGEQLGFTLMHEHVITCTNTIRNNWPYLYDNDAIVAHVKAVLDNAASAGVNSVVDMTTADLGRDICLLQAVANVVSVKIIAATGFWKTPSNYFELAGVDVAAKVFIREATEGIQGTDIRAGIVKITSMGVELSDFERLLVRAAVRAHEESDATIMTHTNPVTCSGQAQQDFLAELGVDLRRVVFGHCATKDLDYLLGLLDRGSYISIDKFGHFPEMPTHAEQIDLIRELCRRQYTKQIVIGHDKVAYSDSLPGFNGVDPVASNFDYFARTVVPALHEAGVTDEQIHLMTTENPAAALDPAYAR